MSNWGSNGFGSSPTTEDLFQRVIDKFPAEMKQAMFAAATTRGPLHRVTWTLCPMNAAGFEVGKQGSVQSIEAAARAFQVSPELVHQFINFWDNITGTDEECTEMLRRMIERAGLFTGPRTRKRAHIERDVVYEDQNKELREEFDSLMESNLIPDTEIALDLLTA